MSRYILTETGKLKNELLPAVYFDSSVLIDYWMTEGMESETPTASSIKKNELPHLEIVRELLRSEERVNKVIEIRKKLLFERLKVHPVISPLCLLELIEWHAEAAFKQIASEVSGTLYIQRKSKKEIGDYLKRIMKMGEDEIREQEEKGRESFESTGLEILMSEIFLNRSFAEFDVLQGLLQADIINFCLTIEDTWMEAFVYAFLQLGAADIMHILFAQHLGCKYFASFDSDLERVKDIITEKTELTVLVSPEEILDIL